MVPLYQLADVKKAAQSGNIIYRGRKVQQNIDVLDYVRSDVKQCLLQLSESDFIKSVSYNGGPYIDDSYKTTYIRCDEDGDELSSDLLYVKFRLNNDILEINLGSFHL